MTWKARITNDYSTLGVDLRLMNLDQNDRVSAIGPLIVTDYDRGCVIPAAFSTNHQEEMNQFLQAIVDAAWDYGVKPTQVLDSHLADMRYLQKLPTLKEINNPPES